MSTLGKLGENHNRCSIKQTLLEVIIVLAMILVFTFIHFWPRGMPRVAPSSFGGTELDYKIGFPWIVGLYYSAPNGNAFIITNWVSLVLNYGTCLALVTLAITMFHCRFQKSRRFSMMDLLLLTTSVGILLGTFNSSWFSCFVFSKSQADLFDAFGISHVPLLLSYLFAFVALLAVFQLGQIVWSLGSHLPTTARRLKNNITIMKKKLRREQDR